MRPFIFRDRFIKSVHVASPKNCLGLPLSRNNDQEPHSDRFEALHFTWLYSFRIKDETVALIKDFYQLPSNQYTISQSHADHVPKISRARVDLNVSASIEIKSAKKVETFMSSTIPLECNMKEEEV